MTRLRCWLGLGLAIAGCATPQRTPPPDPRTPLLGRELTRQDDQLVGQRFRTLLDFEHDTDAVFVRGGQTSITSPGHTGQHSLSVECDQTSISIDPLLYGTHLPGEWTLIGGYVRLPGLGGRLHTSLVVDGKTVAASEREIAPDTWVFTGIDLTDPALSYELPKAQHVGLMIQTQSDRFLLDDVLLVNNRKSLVTTTLPEVPVWSIERVGFATKVQEKGMFDVSIPSSVGNANGWSLEEADPIRARFVNSENKTLTMYADGRVIKGNTMSLAPGASAALAASHERPGEVIVDESTGRLNRDTPGDANNDGYNETRDAYQIVAAGSRLSLRLVPNGDTPVASPVFEIRNLIGQNITATVEGRLFRSIWRVDDSTVLVMLPITIDRPTEITIKTSANESDSAASTRK